MANCVKCGKAGAYHFLFAGGCVCNACMGGYFTCPVCGRLFEQDDYENGDAGNGKCRECSAKEED